MPQRRRVTHQHTMALTGALGPIPEHIPVHIYVSDATEGSSLPPAYASSVGKTLRGSPGQLGCLSVK